MGGAGADGPSVQKLIGLVAGRRTPGCPAVRPALGLTLLIVLAAVCTATPWSAVAGASRPGAVRHTRVGDVSVGYRLIGRGKATPLVMIMGYGGTMFDWDPALLARLAGGRRVIVFDNRGVATTSGPTSGLTIERMADDTAGLIRALGLGRADVFGWSMGGYVAQELALRHPRLVNRLVLAATDPGSPKTVEPSEAVVKLLESGTESDLVKAIFPQTPAGKAAAGAYLGRVSEQPDLRRGYFEIDPKTMAAQLDAVTAWAKPGGGSYAALGRMRQPLLVIDGALDRVVPPTNSRIIADRAPRSILQLYPDAGHAFLFQDYALVAKNVSAFLGQA